LEREANADTARPKHNPECVPCPVARPTPLNRATAGRLPPTARVTILTGMFIVTEADAAAIRTVFEQRGEFAAAVELRRLFPGVPDNAQARECARAIAGWLPLRAQRRPARLRPSKRQ